MIIFYSDHIDENQTILTDDEAKHCSQVLRKKVGDDIHVTDGKGNFAIAEIQSISKKNVVLSTISIETNKKSEKDIAIAIAPPKNRSRWEWFVEKSVEIGIDHIIPLRTKNSERIKLNVERARKIIRSAALQSKRVFHPTISDILSLDMLYVDKKYSTYDKYIAHYHKDNPYITKTSQEKKLLLIGPEGDFTKEEISLAQEHNFTAVNLSDNRLRTETAGIVALTNICNSFYL